MLPVRLRSRGTSPRLNGRTDIMAKRHQPKIVSPYFTSDDYTRLREARHTLANLIGECDRAAACGIDVTDLRRARDEIDQQLSAIERHYMTPNGGE